MTFEVTPLPNNSTVSTLTPNPTQAALVNEAPTSKFHTYVYKGTTLLLRLTPRLAFAWYVGVYGLGYCYKNNIILMDIHMKAIEILFPYVGYAGLGVVMPRVDWYAAVGVQLIFSLAGGLVYDASERVAIKAYSHFFSNKPVAIPPQLATCKV